MTMLNIQHIKGAIFDVDDTLLDNGPIDQPATWLHARSRLAAIHEAGTTHSIPELAGVTPEENLLGFTTASTHSALGAVWNVFYMKGLVPTAEPDPSNSLFPLAEEVTERKNELHEAILLEHGVEVPGASDFIRLMAQNGLANHMALATSAILRDVEIFLRKYELHPYFPSERIISAEKITRHKPDPETFDLAFLSLHLPDEARSQVLAFEDNPRGIISAKAAGLFVCAITTRLDRNNPELLAAQPDLIANSYAEFTKLLGLSITSSEG